jgi:predicted PurR-regulated permease PerM
VTGGKPVEIAPGSLLLLVGFLLGGILLIALAYALREILTQLLAAIVLAMAMEPFIRVLVGRGLSRARAVGIAFLLALAGFITFAFLLLPPLVEELVKFVRDIPNLLSDIAQGQGPLGFLETRFQIVERAREWSAKSGGASTGGPSALHAAGGFAHAGVALVSIPFLTFFVALNGGQWFAALLRALPEGSRDRWLRIGDGISRAVGGYVFGNLLISVIAGAFTTVMLLATGVPHAVPLGLFVGLLDLLPLVGATLAAIIVALVALTKGVAVMVIVIAGMWIYQQIENNLLMQVVYSQTVRLSPLAIALSVAAGAQIGGVMGALLAIPVAGAIKVLLRELLAWRRGELPPEEPPRKPWLRRWLERRSATSSAA